jgi:hypothetical protein
MLGGVRVALLDGRQNARDVRHGKHRILEEVVGNEYSCVVTSKEQNLRGPSGRRIAPSPARVCIFY